MNEATIQRIINVEKHPNADLLDIVSVLGWKCIAKKDEFKIGDLVVYIEIDSFLPVRPEFEFLRKAHYKKMDDGTDGFRVRTIRLRGELSQGICFPLSVFESVNFSIKENIDIATNQKGYWLVDINGSIRDIEEGLDVSEILNVRHYEKPVPVSMRGQIEGYFPICCVKTDETRVQSAYRSLEQLQGQPYYIATKMDGSSLTAYKKEDGTVGVCSRNLEIKRNEDNAYWKVAIKYNIESVLGNEPRRLAIQGELCGPGIQKNPLALLEVDLYVFNVFDINEHRWFTFAELQEFCAFHKLTMVPVEEIGVEFNYTQEQLLEKAKGKYPGTQNNKEGIVIRALDKSVSFKAVSNDYLEKDEE